MSHTLPRVSFHLKTRQEYFFYDEESFGMLKTGFGGTWYSPFLTPLMLFFLKGSGPTTAPFRPIFVAMIFLLIVIVDSVSWW